jgi:hypothetical protein
MPRKYQARNVSEGSSDFQPTNTRAQTVLPAMMESVLLDGPAVIPGSPKHRGKTPRSSQRPSLGVEIYLMEKSLTARLVLTSRASPKVGPCVSTEHIGPDCNRIYPRVSIRYVVERSTKKGTLSRCRGRFASQGMPRFRKWRSSYDSLPRLSYGYGFNSPPCWNTGPRPPNLPSDRKLKGNR